MAKMLLTVGDVMQLYFDELDRVEAELTTLKGSDRSNANGQKHKCERMINILDNFDEDISIEVENCRGDGVIRNFMLTNTGSVCECLVNAIIKKNQAIYQKAWSDDEVDVTIGWCDWEVKTSLDSHFKCTPAQKKSATLLINADGVSLIKKADVDGIVNGQGRLPARGLFGNRDNILLKALQKGLGF